MSSATGVFEAPDTVAGVDAPVRVFVAKSGSVP